MRSESPPPTPVKADIIVRIQFFRPDANRNIYFIFTELHLKLDSPTPKNWFYTATLHKKKPDKQTNNSEKKTTLCTCWLVVWSLSSHSGIFHSYGDVTIASEGLQILTYARH